MTRRVLALSGGVGGAKLALGLDQVLGQGELSIVANTADDFVHLGLTVCPDLDSVMYALAGINNTEVGWGRARETWSFMAAVEELGGETWFQLGDKDLATNVERSRRLSDGDSLTEVTASLCGALGIRARLLPMSDQPVSTVVHTESGPLPFQEYFVKQRSEPVITGFEFAGIDQAIANPAWLSLLEDDALRAIIICPSNPYISIDPMLSLDGVRDALRECPAPVVAVSPIIGDQAVKGPTAKMMTELGIESSASNVASHYGDLLDGFVLDSEDAGYATAIDVPCLSTSTLMVSLDDRTQLAGQVLAFCDRLAGVPD